MNTTPFPTSWIVRGLTAVTLLTMAAGCTTVYVPRYADQGVYYDAPRDAGYGAHPADSPSYGYDRAWAVNPVHYPYWSLDYFYFSTYYHPYSVLVGNWDPYYYPYPGWRYAPHHRRYGHGGLGISIAFGDPWYGYPWRGYGWGWQPVHYGYFGSAWYGHGYGGGYGYGYGHGYRDGYYYGRHDDRHDNRHDNRHPVHRNNDRMRALQRREAAASRNVLVSQRAGRVGEARYAPDRSFSGRDSQPYKRSDLRRGTVQSRSRGVDVSRIERRSSASASRSSAPREGSRGSRIQSRSSSVPRRIGGERSSSSARAAAPRSQSRTAPRRVEPRRAPRAEPRSRAPREVIQSRSIRSSAPPVRRAPAPSSSRAARSLRPASGRARSEAPRASRSRPAVRTAPPRSAPQARSRAPSRVESRAPARSPARAAPSRSSGARDGGGRDRLRSRRGSGRGNR